MTSGGIIDSGSASWQRDTARSSGGYTIIEVMIFLVVTGVLLVSALGVFRGQQERTQFTQAVRETDQRIRTIINEVGSGFFPDNSSFTCEAAPGGISISGVSSAAQGTNEDCIFIGKVVSFEAGERDYGVYTVAGLRQTGGSLVTSLAEARPQIVTPITEQYTVPYGVPILRTAIIGNACENTILAFYQSFGSSDNAGDPKSGSQNVNLYTICSGGSSEDAVRSAVSNTNLATPVPSSGALICFGELDFRTAAVKLGGSGSQLTTEVLIDGAVPEGFGCQQGEN